MPMIAAGIIVAIRVFSVLSHRKLKGIEHISKPRSDIHSNISIIPKIYPNVNQKPELYTKMRVYKYTATIKNNTESMPE